jgi:hypothetical protein
MIMMTKVTPLLKPVADKPALRAMSNFIKTEN